ncbi:uncharacterized protein LOC132788153 [Drosophila nasuta]|uniref:uncharacterized protein LOC132788153 n=1 Tax=Drosophila nasuta TaxID=42062 RepID=UPI00295E2453|nr:uncharacterized protein LOC132788153 [Drosophila nasuta]
MALLTILSVVGVLLLLYKLITANHNVFEKRGLPYEKPLPIVGNNLDLVLERGSFQKVLSEFYARHREHKLAGFFSFLTPIIILIDPEVIKKVTVKDFDHFPNHQTIFPKKERLVHEMMSSLTDQKWKNVRNTLSPSFTASKMRTMFPLMNECIAECMEHLDKKGKSTGKTGGGFELEMKELCNRMSNDIIASTAFGLKVNSYKSPKNDFYEIGKSIIFLRGVPFYKFMLAQSLPWLTDLLGLKVLPPKSINYFSKLVIDTMKYREENNIVRPDMIQMLMETKKEVGKDFTEDELVAQCFTFFFAAFENNSLSVCTTAFELLQNPDVQQKLYEEVKETHDTLNGESLSYEVVMKMKYMDMVLSESLRKWALAPITDRICSKDYTLRDDDGSTVFQFKKGDRIFVPIAGIQLDEQYFPNPHKFDPERFSEENKEKIVPYTYIPFGSGPRLCIGNRYALMTAKSMLFNLVLKYKIERSPRTSKDMLSDSVGFQLGPKNGYWVHLVPPFCLESVIIAAFFKVIFNLTNMDLFIVLPIVGLLFIWAYKWLTAGHDEFIKRGLPFEKPYPLVGNNLDIFLARCSFQKLMAEFYARTRQHKLVGLFNFRTPVIQLNDPEIIKKITIKDFDHFPNHQVFFNTNERLVNDMLSVMKDQRWKHMRNTLTPVFTAAKMRTMFSLMNESFAECMDHLKEKGTAAKSGEGFELEMKEVCNRLSNDLIATTAFGLKVSSYKEPNNEFFKIGQSVAFFRGKAIYKFLLSATLPQLFKLLGFSVFDQNKTDYFIRLVVDTMKQREENNIVRPDMIQLLMEAKKESSENWTDDELVAQCFIFFFAAFENNASLICTTSYELLLNPDIQQKLYEEIKEVHESLKGQPLNYDSVMKMKYMDMVVSESLRKWSLAAATDRLCSKDYTLKDDDGNVIFEFKQGDRINIPIGGLHWDDRYFPNPAKFDPERFSDENKDNIVPYTYLPFGAGPRNCIGNRYALMQAKAMIYNLLLKYRIERSPKTVKDLMSDSRGFQLTPQSGYWVHLVAR